MHLREELNTYKIVKYRTKQILKLSKIKADKADF